LVLIKEFPELVRLTFSISIKLPLNMILQGLPIWQSSLFTFINIPLHLMEVEWVG